MLTKPQFAITKRKGDVKYLNTQDPNKPFYLYLTFNAPHTPYQAPKEYTDRYPNIADPTRRSYAGMVTCLDDEIGRVVAALDKKGLRDNTLIIFHSDNGGTRNAMFAGQIADLSKVKLPCDNGAYRDGKGTLFEGGTRVAACANWPGRIKAQTVDGLIHVVDLYPTLAALAGASTAKCKPLDGLNVWDTIAEGKPSPRSEIIYNVEPFRGAMRQGDWKLVWRTLIPTSVDLYNLASWNDTSPKKAIIAFVEKVTKSGSPDFVPVPERIAVFDNDGTLWAEQPMYFQAFFIFDRIKALAPQYPVWNTKEPFASVLKGDVKSALAGGEHALIEMIMADREHRQNRDRRAEVS